MPAGPRPTTREEAVAALGRERFDVLVVGGGITGAAVAHAAARCRLKVALVEGGDFAGGTSSRSSRLVHGGLRYLAQGRLGLVRACLREQEILAWMAPHLVRPMPFLLPLRRSAEPAAWKQRLLLATYRALAPDRSEARSRALGVAEVLARAPLLQPADLSGGLLYREYTTHDARLVIETILAAEEAGAVVASRVAVDEIATRGACAVGARVYDRVTGRGFEVGARVVVNAAGPWADALGDRPARGRPALRLAKGVHLVLRRDRLPLEAAVVFFSPRDRRPLFAVPQGALVLVGTTDTEHQGDPAAAAASTDDVAYLVEALGAAFPAAGLRACDVAASFAGVRPLPDRASGPTPTLDRDYQIDVSPRGVLSVLGGKLTLHRRAAARALTEILRRVDRPGGRALLRDACAPTRLPGARWADDGERRAVGAALASAGVGKRSAAHLIDTYGSRSRRFLDLLREEPAWAAPVVPGLPYTLVEAVFAARHDKALGAEDFLHRRSDLALEAQAAGCAVPDLGVLFATRRAAA